MNNRMMKSVYMSYEQQDDEVGVDVVWTIG